jgi:carboxyl-terminal processing protease
MKTRSSIGSLPRGIKHALNLFAAVLLFVCAGEVRAASATELLEQGIYIEETRGDLKAATEIYGQIVDDPAAGRALLAQAQLRLGLCQLKLGNKPQAISALERLTQQFPDNEKLLAIIEHHMPQLLDDILKQIEQRYIHEVDRSDLMETALRAIVGKLDASGGLLRTNDLTFLDAREVSQLNESLEQKVAGIGAALKLDETNGEVVVTAVLAHSPALRGGVLTGDRILHVNDVPLAKDAKLADVIKLVRGPAGSPITVSVRRDGADQLLRLQLVRDVVQLPSVKGHRLQADSNWEFMLNGERKIGYVRLGYLGNRSPGEMQTALEHLKSQGMKALVLDLRNNPGGSLDEAIKVADLFLESGRIVTVKGRDGEKAFDAKFDNTFSGFPIAALVNRKTASAAEVIAGALQDHERAIIVGERTFGQGIVRSIMPLKGGLGALKLPVAAYYRPSGKNVNRYPHSAESDDWGVSPNAGFEIIMSDEELSQFEKDFGGDVLRALERPVEFHDGQLEKALAHLVQLQTRSP